MEITPYKPEYATAFREHNVAWLEKLFSVEPHDEEVLGNPDKHIIQPGGQIFFAREGEEILGTVALVPMENGVFELTKMSVTPAAQGKKIGQKLMVHAIDFAQSQGWEKLIIYSSRKLKNALYIYEKYGFVEIPIEENNPYARGDIKMELILD